MLTVLKDITCLFSNVKFNFSFSTSSRIMRKVIAMFFLATSIFSACKKIVSNEQLHQEPKTMEDIFVQFWGKMNYKYVYWDIDTVDWNVVYKNYRPLFAQLKDSDEDKRKAELYFEQMTCDLIDNHLVISFNEQPLVGSVINPSLKRKMNAPNYHSRYYYDDIVETYLDPGFLSGRGNITSNGETIKATTGTIDGRIRYFHCNFFALKKSYEANDGNKVKEVLDQFFLTITKPSASVKGIILDLRGNRGGNIEDLDFFAGKLIDKDLVFGYSRSKDGTGKLNYLPWVESRIKYDPNYHVDVPIILMGDHFSASLSEIIILALKSKNNLFVGEQTYGATGPLSDSDVFNSGSFDVGAFLTVSTSAVEFKSRDGKSYENIGITPDVNSSFNAKELSQGRDRQLEEAMRLIN